MIYRRNVGLLVPIRSAVQSKIACIGKPSDMNKLIYQTSTLKTIPRSLRVSKEGRHLRADIHGDARQETGADDLRTNGRLPVTTWYNLSLHAHRKSQQSKAQTNQHRLSIEQPTHCRKWQAKQAHKIKKTKTKNKTPTAET